MPRKTMLLSGLLLLALLGGAGAGLWFLLAYEPAFYRGAEVPPGPHRQQESRQFEQIAHRFLSDLRYETQWRTAASDQLLNSWLAEDFVAQNLSQWLPAGVSSPRVSFKDDVVRVGFRYGELPWRIVVSLEAKLWLVPREPNVVVAEIRAFRAGAVPLTVKMLQEELTDKARDQNVKIAWYRLGGNPVAVIRFQADKREPTIQLQALAIQDGILQAKGLSLDPQLRRQPAPVPPPAKLDLPKPPALPPHASPLDPST